MSVRRTCMVECPHCGAYAVAESSENEAEDMLAAWAAHPPAECLAERGEP